MAAKSSRIALIAAAILLLAVLAQSRPVAADGSWKPTGPTGGYVWELAVSPEFETDGTIFASTDGAGVVRSTDRGDTWHNVSKGLGHRSIRALAVSPNYGIDSTVFAGGPDGAYKSVDGGETWEPAVAGLDNPRVLAMAVSPGFATDATVFAGVSDGLYRSTDGGGSWQRATGGLTGATAAFIEFSPGFERDSTVFAGMLGQRIISYMWGSLLYETPPGGIFRSTDGGVTWEIYEDLQDVSIMSVSLSPAFELDATAFAGTLHSGIFRTTDGGDSWTQVGQGLPYHRFMSVEVSPGFSSDNTVFAGAHGMVFRSTDGGGSWEQVNGGRTFSNSRVEALAVSPAFGGASVWTFAVSPRFRSDRTLFAATMSGVFRSVDGGHTWEAAGDGLSNLRVHSLDVSPDFGADGTLFAGTSGGLFRSTDAGGSWTRLRKGLRDGSSFFAVQVSPGFRSDRTVFAGTDSEGVLRSVDAGESWEPVNRQLRTLGITGLALPSDYPETLQVFAGTARSGLFRGADLQAGPFFEITRPVPVSRIYPVLGWVLVVLTVPGAVGLVAAHRRITLWMSRRRARRYVGWTPRAAGHRA